MPLVLSEAQVRALEVILGDDRSDRWLQLAAKTDPEKMTVNTHVAKSLVARGLAYWKVIDPERKPYVGILQAGRDALKALRP